MNKIVLDKEDVVEITNDLYLEVKAYTKKEIYLIGNNKAYNINIKLDSNSSLIVHHYSIDGTYNTNIDLNEKAKIYYYFSTINYNDNDITLKVNHLGENSVSEIYNHGVNALSNKLVFDIYPKVFKTSDKCICNQENMIINLKEGNSTIRPNLFIDNYDVISNHSAYIGKFKDEDLFYLMSRGISRKNAYSLLIHSFLINSRDVLYDKIDKFIKEIENI